MSEKEEPGDDLLYRTTSSSWHEEGRYIGDSEPRDAEVPNPECPGLGWRMVGSAATSTRLFWFWEKKT